MSYSLAPVVPSLMTALQVVPDHRQASGKRHRLSCILAFVCCGMLCGAKSLLAIEPGLTGQADAGPALEEM